MREKTQLYVPRREDIYSEEEEEEEETTTRGIVFD